MKDSEKEKKTMAQSLHDCNQYTSTCCDTHQKGQDMTFEELLDKTLAELKSEYEQVKAMHDSMCIDRQRDIKANLECSTLKTET